MISKAESLALVVYLSKAGYVAASDGQADVWADVINDAAPYATGDMLRQAARDIARQPHRWIATGDVVRALHQLRTAQIEADERQQRRAIHDRPVSTIDREQIARILGRGN